MTWKWLDWSLNHEVNHKRCKPFWPLDESNWCIFFGRKVQLEMSVFIVIFNVYIELLDEHNYQRQTMFLMHIRLFHLKSITTLLITLGHHKYPHCFIAGMVFQILFYLMSSYFEWSTICYPFNKTLFFTVKRNICNGIWESLKNYFDNKDQRWGLATNYHLAIYGYTAYLNDTLNEIYTYIRECAHSIEGRGSSIVWIRKQNLFWVLP